MAKQFRSFIGDFSYFYNYLENLKDNKTPKIDVLSEKLDDFIDEAEKNGFLCDPDDELKYDDINESEIEEVFKDLQEIDTAEREKEEEDEDLNLE